MAEPPAEEALSAEPTVDAAPATAESAEATA
jgi:hypothetical protein